MDRTKRQGRINVGFRPKGEQVEVRLLLSQGPMLAPGVFLNNPPGYHLVRPNTPVAPFAASLTTASFIDPSVTIINGYHTVVGQKSYIGPYAILDSKTGFIKIGTGSTVLDNATISTNPNNAPGTPPSVLIGDSVAISYRATVYGPSVIGTYGTFAKPTQIGPNALIDGATVEAGAVVGALARVGPGVTIPSGYYVLPGSNVTTQAEASNPALGMVEKLPAQILNDVTLNLSRASALANGYTYLYQGQSATGANPGTTTTGVYNGNLAAVSGTSAEPGAATTTAATGITFEPTSTGPKFVGPSGALVVGNLYNFPARATGDVRFYASRAKTVANQLGRRNAIRADQGQPISFLLAPSTGEGVTINSPNGGVVSTTSGGTTTTKTYGGIVIGINFQAQSGAVILGAQNATTYVIGNNVTIGQGAVVSASTIFPNAVIGARSYIQNSSIAPGSVIAPGTIMINNKVVGQIQW
jgi:carbonic anhydrase/acetyltransferase-like protein (isoleucine patch superfamily)